MGFTSSTFLKIQTLIFLHSFYDAFDDQKVSVKQESLVRTDVISIFPFPQTMDKDISTQNY